MVGTLAGGGPGPAIGLTNGNPLALLLADRRPEPGVPTAGEALGLCQS